MPDRPLIDHGGGEIGEGDENDRAFLGNDGNDVTIEQVEETLDQLDPDRRVAPGQVVGPDQDHGAGLQWGGGACSVPEESDEMLLEGAGGGG